MRAWLAHPGERCRNVRWGDAQGRHAGYYLTTAIDYVNSRPHLGTAYEKVTADVIARYKRLSDVPTRFVMGNDEHSQNVYRKAREVGLDPLAYCDRMEQVSGGLGGSLSRSTTSSARPSRGIVPPCRGWRSGDSTPATSTRATTKACIASRARHSSRRRTSVDGQCPIHLTKPDWIREKNYFFSLSKYSSRCSSTTGASGVRSAGDPSQRDSATRRRRSRRHLDLPGRAELGDSAAVRPVERRLRLVRRAHQLRRGRRLRHRRRAVCQWWPASLHVVGKDITRFHCVVWPAMLMSAGLPLPTSVFGHGWVHFKGQKMSKSLGTVVDPLEAADRLGPDPLRLIW